jgi:hypothetical protein
MGKSVLLPILDNVSCLPLVGWQHRKSATFTLSVWYDFRNIASAEESDRTGPASFNRAMLPAV